MFTIFISRYVNVGLFYLRQVFFAKFDIKVHTSSGTRPFMRLAPIVELFLRGQGVTRRFGARFASLSRWSNQGSPPLAKVCQATEEKCIAAHVLSTGTFGHITGGYDAGYYGYTYVQLGPRPINPAHRNFCLLVTLWCLPPTCMVSKNCAMNNAQLKLTNFRSHCIQS